MDIAMSIAEMMREGIDRINTWYKCFFKIYVSIEKAKM
jgi:hypothetical protein